MLVEQINIFAWAFGHRNESLTAIDGLSALKYSSIVNLSIDTLFVDANVWSVEVFILEVQTFCHLQIKA